MQNYIHFNTEDSQGTLTLLISNISVMPKADDLLIFSFLDEDVEYLHFKIKS